MTNQLNKLLDEYKKLHKETVYHRPITEIPKLVPYLINVEFDNITAENNIYKHFDFTMINSMYDKKNEFGVPVVYKEIYNLIKKHKNNNSIITYSPDISISLPTTCAIAENYLENNNGIYKSALKIIILTSKPRINSMIKKHTFKEYSESLISSLLDQIENPYFNHNVKIYPEQIIILGINQDCCHPEELDMLNELGVEYYTLQTLRDKGIRKIMNSIKYVDEPIHVVFDMSVTSFKTAPCVFRYDKIIDGFNIEELDFIFTEFSKMNVVGLDVTNFDTRVKKDIEKALRITYEIARYPMKKIFNVAERSLNIFNENSKFLIFRPYQQTDDDDTGWYIFRNITENEDDPIMTNEIKNKLIEEIDDLIIPFNPNNPIIIDPNFINGYNNNADDDPNTILLATTTMDEQNKRIYITRNTDINEKILYSDEKIAMLFEIL